MLKNMKYLGLLAAIHIAIGVLTYFFLFMLENHINDTSDFLLILMIIFRYIGTGITVYFTFKKWAKKCSKFVISASFLIPPFFLYILLRTDFIAWMLGDHYDWEGGWILLFIEFCFFFLPLFVLTLILAIVIKIIKRSA